MRTSDRALFVALVFSAGMCVAFGGRAPVEARAGDRVPASWCVQFAVSPDGASAWVPGSDRRSVRKVDLADGTITASRRFHGTVSAVEISPNGSLLAVAVTGRDRVILTDPVELGPGTEIPVGRKPRLLEFGAEGTDLCVLCTRDEEIDLIDVRKQRLVQIIPLPSLPSSFAHYQSRAAVTLPKTGELVILTHPRHDMATSVSLSPVPDWVAAGGLTHPRRSGHEAHRSERTSEGGEGRRGGEERRRMRDPVPTPVLVVLSRESDVVSVLDGSTLEVLTISSLPSPLLATVGCGESPWAFVLHSRGRKISVLSVDPSHPGFGKVAYTVTLREACEALQVTPQGICWALGVTRRTMVAIDPAKPMNTPCRTIRIHEAPRRPGR